MRSKFGKNSKKNYLCKKYSVMLTNLQKLWYFHFANPTVRVGEFGGFRWRFRRFWLDLDTVSGNFSVRFTADEHPYAYLLAGENDDNIKGFAHTLYTVGKLLTTDQQFVDDIQKAIKSYEERLDMLEVDEDPAEENAAIEEMKQVQEHIELPKKERRKVERDTNGRFKRAVKEVEKNEANGGAKDPKD